MINPIVNAVVLGIFAFIIGCVLQLCGLLMRHRRFLRDTTRQPAQQGKTLSRRLSESRQRAEAMRSTLHLVSRPAWFAMAAFYGLIAVLILFLIYTPLEMKWLIFIPSVLVGFAVTEIVFKRAKAGKLRLKRKLFFDIMPEGSNDK